MLDAQIDLAPIVSFVLQISMVLIGIAYFTGFGVKKVMHLFKSF